MSDKLFAYVIGCANSELYLNQSEWKHKQITYN